MKFMSPFEDCMMLAWVCDYKGERYDGYPVLVELDNIGEFLSLELGIYQFKSAGYMMYPEDWPKGEYPECICGEMCDGDDHFVLEWGRSDAMDTDDMYWAEWTACFHKSCLPGFFELLTKGEFVEDREEWIATRDDPWSSPGSPS